MCVAVTSVLAFNLITRLNLLYFLQYTKLATCHGLLNIIVNCLRVKTCSSFQLKFLLDA